MGTYVATLNRLAQVNVLVLDDFLIAPLKDTERRDLLEVLEDRYGKSSTVITSQVPTKTWPSRSRTRPLPTRSVIASSATSTCYRCAGRRYGKRRGMNEETEKTEKKKN